MLHGPDCRCGLRAIAVLILVSTLAIHRSSAADPPSGSPETPAVPGAFPAYRYCPVCGSQNRPENRFCLKDGTPLPPIDTTRRIPGFVRSPGTYSPEEIEQVMHRVSQSVVRIRVRTTTT